MSRSLGGAMDGGADPLIGAAAADVGHRRIDVGVRGMRLLGEQRRGRHDLARLAVAALRHVFRDPRPLHRVRAVLGQAFDGGDALVGDGGDGQHASAGGRAVQVHRARAALRDAAAELGAREAECVAQHPEERRVGRDVDRLTLAVEGEGNRWHDERSSSLEEGETCSDVPGGGKGGSSAPNVGASGMFPERIVTDPSELRIPYARRLGIFSATMAVIGGIIGSGVFLGPEVVAARVGSAGLTLTAWVLGGIIALAGALCFGELGARRPRAGGGYVYLRDAFGPLAAFLYGWALLLVIATGATAAVAVTFASYTVPLLGLPARATLPLATAAIVLLSAVNYVGVKPAAVTQNVFTMLKLGALAALIVSGLFFAPSTALNRLLPPSAAPGGVANIGVALGAALVPVLFAYGGWQQTNFIAEELIAPERDLPRALMLGVAGVVTVYLLANVAYLRVLGAGGLAASTAPAADVMGRVLGPAGRRLLSAGVAVSTFGFLNLVILVTPRVFQAMAADGVFLDRLARLHPVYRTPAGAIAFMGAWSIVLAVSGSYAQLLDYVVFGDWIFFGLTVASLFIYNLTPHPPLRDAETGSEGGFRVPFYPWTPALFVLAAAYVVVSSVVANPHNALIGTGLLALGVPVYWWARRAS